MRFILLHIIFIFLLLGCAQVQPLSGGKKDVHAAQIDTSKSYPRHQQINFDGESMVIAFNEYVKLQNANKNISFTPTLPEDNEYMIKGKKLVVDFQSELEENTTYRLDIDNGIADYNEGNDSLYTVVFSTGAYLDSGCMKGKVKNAYSNKPMKEVYVLLYRVNNQDSIQNRRADYFTKTDDKGVFSIENIKPGQYEVITLDDQNQSRTYDLKTEAIGFTTVKYITVPDDSCSTLKFKMSAPRDTSIYIKNAKQNKDGSFGFSINNFESYNSIKIENLTDTIAVERDYTVKDSVLFWPQENSNGSVQIVVQYNDQVDTVSIILKALEDPKLKLSNNLHQSDLPPGDTLTIRLNAPIDSIYPGKIKLYHRDTIPSKLKGIIQKGTNLFQIIPLDSAKKYKAIIDSGAVSSKYDNVNDSMAFSYSLMKKSDYSKVIIEFDSNYVNKGFVELYDNEDNVIRKQWVDKPVITFKNLFSISYFVRFIEDKNKNLQWNPGNYATKFQPENVYYLDQSITPKKGWEQKTVWKIEE